MPGYALTMSLVQKIAEDLKQSMKDKNEFRTSCLRMLKTALKNAQVEKMHELKDEETQSVITSLIRKGQEAAVEFRKGNREDMALKEEGEIKVYYEYLPKQLTPEEIEGILRETIAELSVGSVEDLGKVMKVAMQRMAGRAQGKEVNETARKLLS
jgi:uncharacterized protein YqeY